MPCRPPPKFLQQFAFHAFRQAALLAGRNADVTCTSWYRNPIENAAVGGDRFSQHQLAWAIDVVGPGATQFAKSARTFGLTAVVESDHVHVQLLPAGLLRRLLTTRV